MAWKEQTRKKRKSFHLRLQVVDSFNTHKKAGRAGARCVRYNLKWRSGPLPSLIPRPRQGDRPRPTLGHLRPNAGAASIIILLLTMSTAASEGDTIIQDRAACFFFFRVGIRSVTFPWISWQWSRASSVAISESNVCMCICVSSGHSCEISAQMCFCPEVADKAATSCLASYTKDRTFFRELLQELRRYQKKRSCQLRNGSVQTDAFGDRQ